MLKGRTLLTAARDPDRGKVSRVRAASLWELTAGLNEGSKRAALFSRLATRAESSLCVGRGYFAASERPFSSIRS